VRRFSSTIFTVAVTRLRPFTRGTKYIYPAAVLIAARLSIRLSNNRFYPGQLFIWPPTWTALAGTFKHPMVLTPCLCGVAETRRQPGNWRPQP